MRHSLSTILTGLALLSSLSGAAPPKTELHDTAADVVTLKDGSIVRGEFAEFVQGGGFRMIVSRDWARTHQPDALKRWEAIDAKGGNRAIAQKVARLQSWKRERDANASVGDSKPLTTWLGEEIKRLGDPDAANKFPLMIVKFAKADVQRLDRAPKGESQFLRLGWLSHLHEPEESPKGNLKSALEGRGFDLKESVSSSIQKLLPPALQTDPNWLLQRAATEIRHDNGLRFISTSGFLAAEPKAGEPVDMATTLQGAANTIKQLLGGENQDPLPGKLAELAKAGHVGAVVTELQFDPDMQGVTVGMTMWVQSRPNAWSPAGSRKSSVRGQEIDPRNGNALAEDPQIKSVFKIAEALGLGEISNDLKGQSLSVGAATQKALTQAREMANNDLEALALPID